ncbi:CRP-like cAMP-binding protein [Chryseobacterium bernardetii]|uniref:CRP-like cAMP-binding protein n=3 Tax=Chryseobacterium TaxID=59732 RepID=A0A543EJ01_9FLAO|nr:MULTISPECIES: Crp/Fnr family transcriptional regulator [Chryseobacterium]MDR6369997.1 CRP-like cAMP-binding protein [Chryseobacterium vietnamense]MDR6440760.1 CRP-like cAMP-binding protein [Chryseobacterium bernardetii]MDR6458028.1 CRP-like cAMP-binding protein [Chryseobacterium vietnamense]MDR6486736.1 CRP-like cAMP-binding protein [Chryseobacterium vietnamense]TQM21560.1 CRP-like cAMP-binding protein [Chryseobacterium aquifrigidense]
MITETLLISFGAEIKDYKAEDIIFREEESPVYYYQIQKGKIKLNNYTENGKEFIQNIISDGHSFGESLLFVNRPYPMNAVAMEDSSIFVMPGQNFLKLIQNNPEISLNVYQCLAERMYYKYIMLYNLSFQNPVSKLKLLMDYLKSYHDDKNPYSFQIPLTRQQLASLTGLCVETVIRTIKHMEKDQVLKIKRGKIYY